MAIPQVIFELVRPEDVHPLVGAFATGVCWAVSGVLTRTKERVVLPAVVFATRVLTLPKPTDPHLDARNKDILLPPCNERDGLKSALKYICTGPHEQKSTHRRTDPFHVHPRQQYVNETNITSQHTPEYIERLGQYVCQTFGGTPHR